MITEQLEEIIARNKLRHEILKERYKGKATCRQWPEVSCCDCEPVYDEVEIFSSQGDDRHNTARSYFFPYQRANSKLGQNQRKIKYSFDDENKAPSVHEIAQA